MTTASVVVVGAGVIGASVAYHLGKRGVRDVVLVDRALGPGEGSTGRATGGYRATFATAINVQLSLLSRTRLLSFEEETGVDPGYLPAGYLWLAENEGHLDALAKALDVQRAAGVTDARIVDTREAAELNPFASLDGIAGGLFGASDGYIRPMRLLEGYLGAAERSFGARVLWDTKIKGFVRNAAGAITSVRTDGGPIATSHVVNAAGVWALGIAVLAGLHVPVSPLRRQVAATEPTTVLPPDMPMTIFMANGFHLRERDGRVLLLLPSPGNLKNALDISVEPAWLDRVAREARRRFPVLSSVAIDPAASWAGLYEMSPDGHAIVGAPSECPNLILANGSSGHGVMHSPAIGALVAEMIVDGKATSLDVRALRPSRFAEGEPNRAAYEL